MGEGLGGALLALAAALIVWAPAHVRGPVRVRATGGEDRAVRRLLAVRSRHRETGTAGRAAGSSARAPEQRGQPPPAWRRLALAGGAGLAVAVVLGGLSGVVGGVVVGAAGDRLLRGSGDGGHRRAALLGDLPVACDLLAVCLSAGVPVGTALAAVAGAVPDPLRQELELVAGLHRLGADPRQAWAAAPAELAALGRVLVRAGESGSAVGRALRAVAGDVRAAERSRADERVRRVGVWLLAPLGACFLPAFLCLGVAPVVLGIAATVFR